nr:putative B3 domain-containing protein At1g78640 [Ipomoea batatas]
MESVSSNSTTTTVEDLGNLAELIDAASSFSLSLFPPTKNPKKPIKNHHRWDDDLIDAASSLSLSLPTKRKRLPKPKKPENSSIQEKEEEGVIIAKRQKKVVDKNPPTGALENHHHWIHKRLSTSDVNLSSRLLLPKEEIIKYVLPLMDMESPTACENRGGLRVKIWDLDTESEHQLSLKQWKTGSFVLNSNWNTEFVKRRSLQLGDTISMCWDFENLRQMHAATFAIFVIIIAKPFGLQHRDFLLRHSHVPMASRGIIITGSSCVVIQNHFTIQEISRINDISPQCGESAQEEGKSSLPRSQVEKWIEVDFEAVVAQSKGGYGRSCHRSYSCNRPNPQSSVTWILNTTSPEAVRQRNSKAGQSSAHAACEEQIKQLKEKNEQIMDKFQWLESQFVAFRSVSNLVILICLESVAMKVVVLG